LRRCIILLSLTIILLACENPTENQQAVVLSGLTMGTTYTIKLNISETKIDRPTISTEIYHRLDEINSQMSTYMETSTLSISLINGI